MGEIFQFVKYNFRRLWCSPRPYITLFMVYALLNLCFGGAREYLSDSGETVQAFEFFIIAMANRIPQWIMVFGILILLGDAPFLHDGMEVYILRSSRGRWLMGQVVFCALTVLGYLVLIAVMFLFMFCSYISFTNEWSDAIILSCRIQSGAVLNIVMLIAFPMEIINSGSPYSVLALSFLYTALMLLLCALLCMLCNVRLKTGVGCFAVTILLVWRFLLDNVGGAEFLHYLSPCSLATVSDRAVTPISICYTVGFFLCACFALCWWNYCIIQKADLQKKVQT